jgi:HD-GYP domain-containing protein (c-di-GMP phosphodiesterase class II)
VLGARILQPVAFLAPHLHIVELHHERPDGRGYPHGLVGDAIPLFARIVHVADAFDAMTSARAYRPARPYADALAELRKNIGTDFDADVVAAMLVVWQQRLAALDGAIPVDRLPFRDPAEFGPAARVRASLREARPVA